MEKQLVQKNGSLCVKAYSAVFSVTIFPDGNETATKEFFWKEKRENVSNQHR